MAFTLQDNLSFTGTGTNTSVHLNTVPAGSMSIIAVCINQTVASPITSITDNSGNTYTALPVNIGTAHETQVFYCLNMASAGNASTITVTPANSAYVWSAVWAIFSGVATSLAQDATATAIGTGTSLSSGATSTTVQASELVIGAGGQSNNRPFTAAGGYTGINQAANGTSAAAFMEYLVVSSTGAQTATATIDLSNNWTMGAYTFTATPIGTVVNKNNFFDFF